MISLLMAKITDTAVSTEQQKVSNQSDNWWMSIGSTHPSPHAT